MALKGEVDLSPLWVARGDESRVAEVVRCPGSHTAQCSQEDPAEARRKTSVQLLAAVTEIFSLARPVFCDSFCEILEMIAT